jgi:hypothetical protein
MLFPTVIPIIIHPHYLTHNPYIQPPTQLVTTLPSTPIPHQPLILPQPLNVSVSSFTHHLELLAMHSEPPTHFHLHLRCQLLFLHLLLALEQFSQQPTMNIELLM